MIKMSSGMMAEINQEHNDPRPPSEWGFVWKPCLSGMTREEVQDINQAGVTPDHTKMMGRFRKRRT